MKAFLATSPRNAEETKRVAKILNSNGVECACSVSGTDTLQGAALFTQYAEQIGSADFFLTIQKQIGIDTAVEIGIAHALGKRCYVIVYDKRDIGPDDTMAYHAAGRRISEGELESVINGLKTSMDVGDGLPFHICDAREHFIGVVRDLNRSFESGRMVDAHYVSELENSLRSRFDQSVVLTSSGTSALSLTLQAILGTKREVVVPSLTFPATIQAVLNAGGKPVYADVQKDSWTLCPEDVSRKCGEKCGAILPVHLFGVPADLGALEKIGQTAGVPVVYDACQAFGSTYKDSEIGAGRCPEVFSLDATKIVTGGLGGFVSADDGLTERIRVMKNLGCSQHVPVERGTNSRVLEFTAILALRSLRSLDRRMAERQGIANEYESLIEDLPFIESQTCPQGSVTNHQMYGVLVNQGIGAKAQGAFRALAAAGLGSRVFAPILLHKDPIFGGHPSIHLPVTERIAPRLLCLPIHHLVTPEHVSKIGNILRGLS
jgi:dTDP-4-amino-4,6-dideoxygalactose transaminase